MTAAKDGLLRGELQTQVAYLTQSSTLGLLSVKNLLCICKKWIMLI